VWGNRVGLNAVKMISAEFKTQFFDPPFRRLIQYTDGGLAAPTLGSAQKSIYLPKF
jgi:hypothetical protein